MADGFPSRQDVLGIALELHMWATGSYPDLPEEDARLGIEYLKQRLSSWSHQPRTEVFDNSVRLLLSISVAEASLYLESFGG